MFEQVKNMLAKQLHVEASVITPETKIKEELGADSLDILQILMTMEEDYGITIPDEALVSFRTVSDVVNYLEANKNA